MVNKKDKKENKKIKKKIVKSSKKSDKAKGYAFRRINHPEETKLQSKLICGYKPGTKTTQIEAQPAFKNAIEELKHLALVSKCDPASQLTFFQEMRDNKKISPTPRIESGKEINRMLGYHAPQQVELQQEITQNVSVLVAAIRTEGVSLADMIRVANSKGRADVNQ